MKNNWFSVTQVTNQIYAIAEFSHWEKVVSYLLVDQTKAFLIDTGMGYEPLKDVVRSITTLPITVLLSHSHWDHIGGVPEFKNVYIYDDRFETDNLKQGFKSKNIVELTQNEMFLDSYNPKEFVVLGRNDFELIRDQQIIQSDSFLIKVIHVPGHTPGSVCFYVKELNAIFTGDSLYPGPIYLQLPESNIFDYMKSIENLAKMINPKTLILPGHNAITSSFDLVLDANKLCDRLMILSKNKSISEIKGELLSFLLPNKASLEMNVKMEKI